ncbi:hypothetical protein AD428_03520 [Achromobacter sp. DMS1]|nr:hypothetical protein AD428_21965 [Achromobacter sp. DMS1]KOF55010.1 hypothetical protein AD428_03520 [Achromobacter sp. DMS1]
MAGGAAFAVMRKTPGADMAKNGMIAPRTAARPGAALSARRNRWTLCWKNWRRGRREFELLRRAYAGRTFAERLGIAPGDQAPIRRASAR